jgi:hypothetical protein
MKYDPYKRKIHSKQSFSPTNYNEIFCKGKNFIMQWKEWTGLILFTLFLEYLCQTNSTGTVEE